MNMKEYRERERERENITTQTSLQTFLSNNLHISNSKAAYLRDCGLLCWTDLMISRTNVKPKLHEDSNTRANIITMNMTCAGFTRSQLGDLEGIFRFARKE